MSRTVHPSELAQLLQNRFIAKSAAVSILALSLILLAGGTRSQFPESRLWLFGSALCCAFLSRMVHQIAIDAERQFDDSKDISLTNWQNQLFKRTRDESLTLTVEPASTEPERLPLFDWSELQDEDEHPVLAIVAPMGGGKSRLARYLAKYAVFSTHPQITAFDVYARDQDWDYAATDYSVMLAIMQADIKEINDRIPRYRAGESNFQPNFRVLEEAVDTLPSVRAVDKSADQIVDDWLRKHVSVARKIGFRLCLVSVKLKGTDIGIGSESRDDATVIFAGNKGVVKAMSDIRYLKLGTQQNAGLRAQLQASLVGVKRPAIVFASGVWYPASIPDLTATGDPVGTVQTVALDEVEEDSSEDERRLLLDEITTVAIKLNRQQTNCTPGRIRQYIRSCKSASDETIIEYFQSLDDEGRGTLDRSGKSCKFTPNTENTETKDSA